MIRVLLVENNSADAKRATEMLRETENGQIEVTHVERLSSALHRLTRESFDAILLDRILVDTHGLDTLDLIQAALGRMPIVVLGDKDDEAAERQMIQHGAQEVVIKEGSTSVQLARAVRHAVERKKAEQHLSYLAQHDPLTTLANRMLFRDRMAHAVAMAKRKKHVVGLVLCGLDSFKETIRMFGQEAGDRLLKEAADRLKKCLHAMKSIRSRFRDPQRQIDLGKCTERDGCHVGHFGRPEGRLYEYQLRPVRSAGLQASYSPSGPALRNCSKDAGVTPSGIFNATSASRGRLPFTST